MALSPGTPQAEDEPLMDINTTPLIDVMLVLLIMLIVTIPIQTHALRLATPQASTAPPPPALVTVDIAADGTVSWNGQVQADRTAWTAQLDALAALPSPPPLHLKPDRRVPYRHVAAVLATAQQRGLQQIGIVDDPDLLR